MALDVELPLNFADLPDELKVLSDEALYRRAYIRKWAYSIGDPRLHSNLSEKDDGVDLEKEEVVCFD